jgi:hypothetical protein
VQSWCSRNSGSPEVEKTPPSDILPLQPILMAMNLYSASTTAIKTVLWGVNCDTFPIKSTGTFRKIPSSLENLNYGFPFCSC